MILLLLFVNFVISVFNSWSVGRSWAETRSVGGLPRFMAWMGATMASVGFSWCYLVIIAFAAGPDGFHRLSPKYVQAMFSLGYLALIIPCTGSGLAITVDSWMYFWKRRTFGSGAAAAWNSFADVYNIYEATQAIPSAWNSVAGVFFPSKSSSSSSSSSSNDDDNGAAIVFILVVCALLAGVLTAVAIIRTVSQATVNKRYFDYAHARGQDP
jgi:hypothetical protein